MTNLDMYMQDMGMYSMLSKEDEEKYISLLSNKESIKLLKFVHFKGCDKPTLNTDLLFISLCNNNEYKSIIEDLIRFHNGLEGNDPVINILIKYQEESNKLGRALNHNELRNVFKINYEGDFLSSAELLSEIKSFMNYKIAYEKMIVSNLRLVIKMASRAVKPRYMSMEDLVAEGNVALMRAVVGYENTHDCKFSTYAAQSIRRAIEKYIKENSRNVKIPLSISDNLSEFKRRLQELRQQEDHELSIREIAKKLDMTRDQVIDYLTCMYGELSINQKVTDEESSAIENVLPSNADIENEVTSKNLKEDIESLLGILDDRYRDIVEMRFGLGEYRGKHIPVYEIAKKYGVKSQCISGIVAKSLFKMKRAISYNEKQKSIGDYYYND